MHPTYISFFYSQLFGTATFANNATLFAELFRLATENFLPVQNVEGFQASFVLQPISKAITSKAKLNGGNSLGISSEDGDLVCKSRHFLSTTNHHQSSTHAWQNVPSLLPKAIPPPKSYSFNNPPSAPPLRPSLHSY